MLDFQSLTCALLVAELLSIRRAADRLGINSTAVMRRVNDLERQVGVRLFERRRTGTRPTLAGRRFLDQARRAVAELDSAVRGAGSPDCARAGALTVAFYPSLASGMLLQILAEYRALVPNVDVAFAEGAPADQLAALIQRRADVAFLFSGGDERGIDSEHLWDERASAVLAKDHPLAAREGLTWAELKQQRFLVRAYGSGPAIYTWLAGKLQPEGYAPDIQQHDVCRESLLGLVGAGYGITVVSRSATDLVVPGVVFRPITDTNAGISIRMAWLPTNDNPVLGPFLSHARRVARRAQSGR